MHASNVPNDTCARSGPAACLSQGRVARRSGVGAWAHHMAAAARRYAPGAQAGCRRSGRGPTIAPLLAARALRPHLGGGPACGATCRPAGFHSERTTGPVRLVRACQWPFPVPRRCKRSTSTANWRAMSSLGCQAGAGVPCRGGAGRLLFTRSEQCRSRATGRQGDRPTAATTATRRSGRRATRPMSAMAPLLPRRALRAHLHELEPEAALHAQVALRHLRVQRRQSP